MYMYIFQKNYLAQVRVQQQQRNGERDEELVDGIVRLHVFFGFG